MSSLQIRLISSQEVESIYNYTVAIDSQRRAFRSLGSGEAQLPNRLLLDGPGDSATFCYAARLAPDMGVVSKFGGVEPRNVARGLPSIAALVTVLDAETGRPCAIMEGTQVTTRRTAAASAVAIENLAHSNATTLSIFGSGVQAEAHARAISEVLDLSKILIFNRGRSEAAELAKRLDAELAADVGAVESARHAVEHANVVALCTTSFDPLFELSWLRPGTTVVSIGSFAKNRCEVPPNLTEFAQLVVVDDLDTSIEHAGPIIEGIKFHGLNKGEIATLGSIVSADVRSRQNGDDIVYFNSVGIGVQDAAAANAILEIAERTNAGRKVEL